MTKTTIFSSGNQTKRNSTSPSIKVEVTLNSSNDFVDSNNMVVEKAKAEVNDRASAKVLLVTLKGCEKLVTDCIQALEAEGFSRCNVTGKKVCYD